MQEMLTIVIFLAFLVHGAALKKVVIITGSNSGVGYAAAKLLTATNDYKVIFACRSKEKALRAMKSLPTASQQNAEFRYLDLGDLSTVKSFCDEYIAGKEPLHCLALNAGVQAGRAKVPNLTKQGFEETVGTNHLGHFYMIKRLLPILQRTGTTKDRAKIVITASGVHNPAEPGGDVGAAAGLGDLKGLRVQQLRSAPFTVDGVTPYDSDKCYKDSKLLNVITTLELARRLGFNAFPPTTNAKDTITVNCFNPGLVPTTGLFRQFSPLFVAPFTFLTRNVFKVAVSEEVAGARLADMITAGDRADATSQIDTHLCSGRYYSSPVRRSDRQSLVPYAPSVEAQDVQKAQEVWRLSEALIKDFL